MLVAVLCLTFSGVSSAASSAASSRQAEAQVRAAWTEFKHALVTKSPSGLCGVLSAKASRELVADVTTKPRPTSCEAAAADLFKVAGGSAIAKVQLLTVRVSGDTATTTDTAGPPAAHWVRTGLSTWKLAYLPPNL
jgi:hypothetical protein